MALRSPGATRALRVTLLDRYALDGHQQTLEQQAAVLNKLAAAAAS